MNSCTAAPPWFSLLMCQYWILIFSPSPASLELVLPPVPVLPQPVTAVASSAEAAAKVSSLFLMDMMFFLL